MKFSEEKIDLLTEIINVGAGRAASVLNEMIDYEVNLDVPTIEFLSVEFFEEKLREAGNKKITRVGIGFNGLLKGNTELILSYDSAVQVASLLTGEAVGSKDLGIVAAGAISEVGNIIINGVMGTFANMLDLQLDYTIPELYNSFTHDYVKEAGFENDVQILLCKSNLKINEISFNGEILIIVNGAFIGQLDGQLEKRINT